MGGSKPVALLIGALVAAAAGVSPARGQCRLCEKPVTGLSQSPDGDGISLEVQTSLNFDRLILAASRQGAAVLRPDGSNSVEGGVTDVSARAMVGTAVVHGMPGRTVRIDLPQRIDLYSLSGGRITVDRVVTNLTSLPRLDSAGNLTFHFGGRVAVTGDSDGDYRGEMPITVEYQ
jgi:hypothetical protein